jgi:bifunctional DNA-binding transcriptional regulator/antitoxin component of YhaV-PrlF toxin-antitoxin module
METLVVELGKEGTITLPESIRRDLPPGTTFYVRREKDSIVLQAVRDALSAQFDLSQEAFEFVNDLVAEERQEYLVQVALTNESQE